MKRILKIVAKTLIEYARIIAICFVACVIGAIFYVFLGKIAYACYWIAVILLVIIRDITIKSKMQESKKIKLLLLILSILVYTLFSRMFDLMQPPVVKHSIAVA